MASPDELSPGLRALLKERYAWHLTVAQAHGPALVMYCAPIDQLRVQLRLAVQPHIRVTSTEVLLPGHLVLTWAFQGEP